MRLYTCPTPPYLFTDFSRTLTCHITQASMTLSKDSAERFAYVERGPTFQNTRKTTGVNSLNCSIWLISALSFFMFALIIYNLIYSCSSWLYEVNFYCFLKTDPVLSTCLVELMSCWSPAPRRLSNRLTEVLNRIFGFKICRRLREKSIKINLPNPNPWSCPNPPTCIPLGADFLVTL